MNEPSDRDVEVGEPDDALGDAAAMSAEMLRTLARRWRARLDAGRLGRRSRDDVVALVSALESAARVVESGAAGAASLVENPERFRLVIESVTDYAIYMLDPGGRIVSWNAGAQRIKGYTADEVLGQHFSVFYTEDDRRRAHPEYELREALARGSYAEEGWRLRKDGSAFWGSVVITALRDAQGRHVGFAKVTRDLTERIQAEELLRQSEERLRLLVESVKDYAIYMLDPDGRIATWNAGAEHIKGYQAAEVLGKHFSMFYPPEDVAAGRPARELAIATARGRYEEEGWRVRKDGGRFWASVVITSVHDASGRLRGFAKVTRDHTERRRIEDEARAAEAEALRAQARALEAQNAVKQRDEFISVAAHELRTPLTALQLKLQGLGNAMKKPGVGGAAGVVAHLADRLDGALRQVDRLAGLVERLLDVSRIVDGELVMHFGDADLAEVARAVVEDFREPALKAGSELRFHARGAARGRWDKARLEQVAINLVSNAVKYGAGKPIDVTVEAGDDGVARLVVVDRGIGIPAEDVDRIFGRFERAVPVRHYGGLGLGLYVAQSIVAAHGGTIRVSSREGHGSTFTVELPVGDGSDETPTIRAPRP